MKRIVTGPQVAQWVAKRSTDYGDFGPCTGIGLEADGQLVCGVLYNGYTKRNICMHIASDGTRRWMNRDYLWYCFYYPFVQVGVDRVTGLVGEGNAQARRFDEHLGFREEGRLRGACETGDLIIYVMWRDDCRFLRLKHDTKKAA